MNRVKLKGVTTVMGIAGFKTKKALKERVKGGPVLTIDALVDTSMFGSEKTDGRHAIVGPSPYDRRWYASITVKDGEIVQVS